jgi:hypothetical protein
MGSAYPSRFAARIIAAVYLGTWHLEKWRNFGTNMAVMNKNCVAKGGFPEGDLLGVTPIQVIKL